MLKEKREKEERLILAIETAVGGGSISLLKNQDEIDFWEGQKGVSRAEELIPVISGILSQNNLGKEQVDLIAVSRGPGSFTGLRIGLATARGLKEAFRCDCAGVPVLEAMAFCPKFTSGRVISAFAVNKDEICRQMFEIAETGRIIEVGLPELVLKQAFRENVPEIEDVTVVIDKILYDEVLGGENRDAVGGRKYFKLEGSLARCIGIKAQAGESSNELEPIYMRDTRIG